MYMCVTPEVIHALTLLYIFLDLQNGMICTPPGWRRVRDHFRGWHIDCTPLSAYINVTASPTSRVQFLPSHQSGDGDITLYMCPRPPGLFPVVRRRLDCDFHDVETTVLDV